MIQPNFISNEEGETGTGVCLIKKTAVINGCFFYRSETNVIKTV
jgi:hypothetical protein